MKPKIKPFVDIFKKQTKNRNYKNTKKKKYARHPLPHLHSHLLGKNANYRKSNFEQM